MNVPEQDFEGLLGETVLDRLSGQLADVIAYDEAREQFLIEFVDEEDNADTRQALMWAKGSTTLHAASASSNCYEAGHKAWRFAEDLQGTPVAASAEADPQELAIQAENEDEIELLVRKGYAGLIAAALLGDEEATRKVRALICQIGD